MYTDNVTLFIKDVVLFALVTLNRILRDGMNESFNHPSVSDCPLQYFLITFDNGVFSWNSCYLFVLSSRKLLVNSELSVNKLSQIYHIVQWKRIVVLLNYSNTNKGSSSSHKFFTKRQKWSGHVLLLHCFARFTKNQTALKWRCVFNLHSIVLSLNSKGCYRLVCFL